MEPNSSSLINQNISDKDKTLLKDIAHKLLSQGSLIRSRASDRPLYDWTLEHHSWVEEWAELLGLKLLILRDERIIMAIPEVPSMTYRLRKDETLVALALWYDYDQEIRGNGAHEVALTLKSLNESLQSKFPNILPLSLTRLREILREFVRFNLLEVEWQTEITDSLIQILPTLRFVIPFPNVEEWLKHANRFKDDNISENIEQDETTESEPLDTITPPHSSFPPLA